MRPSSIVVDICMILRTEICTSIDGPRMLSDQKILQAVMKSVINIERREKNSDALRLIRTRAIEDHPAVSVTRSTRINVRNLGDICPAVCPSTRMNMYVLMNFGTNGENKQIKLLLPLSDAVSVIYGQKVGVKSSKYGEKLK